MKPIKIVMPISSDPDAPTQSLLGLGALAAELAAQGVSVRELFARTGLDASQLEDPHARISHRQRLAIYLRYRADLPYEEIGAILGIAAPSARSNVSHALDALRVELGEEGSR